MARDPHETHEQEAELFDQFAMAAMQALITKLPVMDREKHAPALVEKMRDDVAASAYEYAAAMLQERSRRYSKAARNEAALIKGEELWSSKADFKEHPHGQRPHQRSPRHSGQRPHGLRHT